jgi:beta-galactosidase
MSVDGSKNGIRTTISLNGEWRFVLDAEERLNGSDLCWEEMGSSIGVPGSWEEQGIGEPSMHEPIGTWKKLREYIGSAWYAKEIRIPEHPGDMQYSLILSGAKWRSEVWLDGRPVGTDDSLVCEHIFDLTPFVKPGTAQRLMIKLDNRMFLPLPESHIHSYHTATNWGGITGGARIEAVPASRIGHVRVVPNAGKKSVALDIGLSAVDRLQGPGWEVSVEAAAEDGTVIAVKSVPVSAINGHSITMELELGDQAQLWNDKQPALYRIFVQLLQAGAVKDACSRRFGLRSVEAKGKSILLNGNPVYLRGYVDCCIFPLTGYPVWDREEYRRQFRIAKEYGFNHVRLHGWTAPEPFWEAADEEGMLVQTELPHWSNWYNPQKEQLPAEVHDFLKRELERIIRTLNAHPSFIMLSLGNELTNQQGHAGLNELVQIARGLDASRIYTDNTGFGDLPALDREGDFYIPTMNWHTPFHIDHAAAPNSYEDYRAVTVLTDKPVIAHEHGQFTMYVRPSEESKYTGILRPNWLKTTVETLESKKLTDRVEEFGEASGALLVRCLKETMEKSRRTPGLSGIQLLDIRDFPGQGHATTGILDVFWDRKGIIEPELFRRFNDETVLVMRSEGRTLYAGETYEVRLECSHFGSEPIRDGVLRWELAAAGTRACGGSISGVNIAAGSLGFIGLVPLQVEGPQAQALELQVTLEYGEGRQAVNSWEFWVYPRPCLHSKVNRIWSNVWGLRPSLSGAVFKQQIGLNWLSYIEEKDIGLAITDQLSRDVIQYVLDGGSAWLMVKPGRLHDEVDSKFLPIFWNYLWFPGQEGTTMGMVVHGHPLTSRFPHEGTSNWQWYHLVDRTPAIGLDSVPQIKPIVEVMDNFNRGKKLAYAFEAQIGKGKLYVSTFRLSEGYDIKRPESAYMLQQTVDYLMSGDFNPSARLSIGELLGLFKLKNRPV